VVVGSLSGRMYCLDVEGAVLWSFRAREAIEGSPIIAGERIVFGSMDNRTYCLDLEGSVVWEHNTESFVTSTPALDKDGTIMIGTGGGAVLAIGEPFPSQPRFLISRPGDSLIHLSWSEPTVGSGILHYNVYRRNETDWSLLTTTEDRNYTDTGMRNGLVYTYVVSAENDVGEGMLSNTAQDIPFKKEDPTITEVNVDEGIPWEAVGGIVLIIIILALIIWGFRKGKEDA